MSNIKLNTFYILIGVSKMINSPKTYLLNQQKLSLKVIYVCLHVCDGLS